MTADIPRAEFDHALRVRFGRQRVFFDVDSIVAGAEFPQALSDALERSGVFLAIIGEHWLDSRDQAGSRRLDDASDFVRREIAEALQRRLTIIPVLLDDAKLPSASELPQDIRGLVTRNFLKVRHETFANDVVLLMGAVQEALRPSPEVVRNRRKKMTRGAAAFGAVAAAMALGWWLEPVRLVREMHASSQQSDADRRRVSDHAAWSAAELQNTIESYRTYLQLHPAGNRKADAERQIAALAEAAAAEKRRQEGIAAREQAEHERQTAARRAREDLERRTAAVEEAQQQKIREDNAAFDAAKRLDQPGAFRLYLEQRPDGHHRERAFARLAELGQIERDRADAAAWERAHSLNRLDEFKEYLRRLPEGRHAGEAKAEIERREKIARRLTELKDKRAPAEFRDLLGEAHDTELASRIVDRLDSLERAEKSDWTKAETVGTRSAYEAYAADWPHGDFGDKARERLAKIDKSAEEWRRIKGRGDEAALEAFLKRDYIADFENAALAELVFLKRARQKPLPPNIAMLSAADMVALLDGRKLRLSGEGTTISFSRRARQPEKLKLRPSFLQTATKERYAAEGGFSADLTRNARPMSISGIGGIQESRVDKTGHAVSDPGVRDRSQRAGLRHRRPALHDHADHQG